MPILVALGSLLLFALILGPSIWVRYVFKKYSAERPDLPGTGGELARHLLDEAKLTDVKVEITDKGDQYDPAERAVRLLRGHYDGKSITAVAIAAHEVSHAAQHAYAEPSFMRRTALVAQLVWVERLAGVILLLAPAIFALVRSPVVVLLDLFAGMAMMGIAVVVHVSTLPVEFDASFGKALPVLQKHRYLAAGDLPAARVILQAAAFTYVAAALAALLNIVRWFRSF